MEGDRRAGTMLVTVVPIMSPALSVLSPARCGHCCSARGSDTGDRATKNDAPALALRGQLMLDVPGSAP